MSGLISPIETETQEFGLQLGNSSEFPAVYIADRVQTSTSIFKLFLSYNNINLVAGSGSAVTLSLRVCRPRRLLPPPRPVRSSGGPAAPLRLRGRPFLAEARAGQMDFPARCAGCPAPPATPATGPRPAVRRAIGTARRLWRPMPSWAAPASFPVSNILPLERS